jgi:hypothetical protein
MKRWLELLVVVSFLAASAVGASAAEDLTPEKRQGIVKLMEVTGASNAGQVFSEAIIKQMAGILKQARPDLPDELFKILEEEVNKATREAMIEKDGFIELSVMIYHKYFSLDEIKALVAFYETPLGKKTSSLTPIIAQESMAIGQQWGRRLGPLVQERVKARFREKGFEL